MPALYNVVWSCWSSPPASVETACLPAGCGLGQIKSLIHEGGWMEEGGNGEAEQRRGRGGAERRGRLGKDEGISEGEARKCETAWGKGGGGERRRGKEGKNDPADRLYLGLRIDVYLSPVSVISPTNHDTTSTGQYLTLQASSSHTLTSPLSARTAQQGHDSSLNSSIWLLITWRARHTWVKQYLWTNSQNLI